MGGKGVELIMVTHVPDVLEQNPSGFEFYSPKSRFLSGRQRHLFKLIDPSAYLGKSAKIYEEKIKNKNRHETGLRSPKIEKRPPQPLGGVGSGFFGLGGPSHNASTQFPEKKFLLWDNVVGS